MRRHSRPCGSFARIAVWPALLLMTASADAREAPARSIPGMPAQACTVRELSRTPLVIDGGREMYIEPTAVVPRRGEILLAGSPNYIHPPAGQGSATDFIQDSVFGAILSADGDTRLVPAPVGPARVFDIRGAAIDGGWAVVFAELKHPWRPPAPDTVAAFWYGVYDGREWTRLERLPQPAGTVLIDAAPDFLLRGDTLFFAARVRAGGVRDQVALYELRAGQWNLRTVKTDGVVYVRFVPADSGAPSLGVVSARADRPGYDKNSLFLHPPAASWSTWRRIIQGHPEPIYDPAFALSAAGPVLTWWVQMPAGGRRARAIVGPRYSRELEITLDSSINGVLHVNRPREAPLWVVHHLEANGISELRFIMLDQDGKPSVRLAFPNPYTGFFGATATGPHEVLLSGPLLRPEALTNHLVTLLIRVRVECAQRAP